jgi:hypothetical protein
MVAMTGDDARVIPPWEASSARSQVTVPWVRLWFRGLKLPGPPVTGMLPVVTGVFSVGVVLFQCHARWIGYRPAAEVLIRERHLDQARARAFQGESRDRLLAGRVEELPTRESAGCSGSEQAVGRVRGASR